MRGQSHPDQRRMRAMLVVAQCRELVAKVNTGAEPEACGHAWKFIATAAGQSVGSFRAKALGKGFDSPVLLLDRNKNFRSGQ